MRRIPQALLVIALIISVGGHWALLQGVAWAGMVIRFSQTMTVSEAVEATFDGEHRCRLCRVVEEGRQQEQKSPEIKSPEKPLLYCQEGEPVLLIAPEVAPCLFSSRPLIPRSDPPPRPRPRSA